MASKHLPACIITLNSLLSFMVLLFLLKVYVMCCKCVYNIQTIVVGF